jgi:hypothetical protein
MNAEFSTVHNHHERSVYDLVREMTPQYGHLADQELLADIACVALNRLPPRYIRHDVDFAFYLTERERAENERAITEAVTFAFEFVQARVAMRARR